jgi:hypothetical protein
MSPTNLDIISALLAWPVALTVSIAARSAAFDGIRYSKEFDNITLLSCYLSALTNLTLLGYCSGSVTRSVHRNVPVNKRPTDGVVSPYIRQLRHVALPSGTVTCSVLPSNDSSNCAASASSILALSITDWKEGSSQWKAARILSLKWIVNTSSR